MNQPATKTALIVGATSGIGRAVAARWASQGYNVILAARDMEDTAALAADIALRYNVQTHTLPFDASDFSSHAPLFDAASTHFPTGLDAIVLCHGYMAPQSQATKDLAASRLMIDTNYTSVVTLLNHAADYFEKRKHGVIVAVSSVAADRGRQSNYIYGSTKAAMSTYLQGLRHRLWPTGVRVVNIKPGFVDTGMTWGLPGVKNAAPPEKVAALIFKAAQKGKAVAYTPGIWRYIMFIIRSVPEVVFNKTKL